MPFVLVLWLLLSDSRRPSRAVFLVFPLIVLWANLHGSVAIGVALVMLRGLTGMYEQVKSNHATSPKMARALALVALPPICLVASPYGASMIDYYRRMLVNPTFAPYIGEWRPPTFFVAMPFFVFALAAVWLLARPGKQLSAFEKFTILATIAEGYVAIRGITWFGLAAVAILPRALDAALPAASRRPRTTPALRFAAQIAAIGVPATFLILSVLPSRHYEREWPSGATAAIASATDGRPWLRVWASERYADWLLWKMPNLDGRVAYDVRFELFSKAELREVFNFRNRVGADWARPARRYDLIVLDRNRDREVDDALVASHARVRLYADSLVSVLSTPEAARQLAAAR